MNKYQKLFSWFVVVVSLGAGLFHFLATFSPVIASFFVIGSVETNLILSLVIFVSLFLIYKMGTAAKSENEIINP